MSKGYGATSLIGGGVGSLDAIPVADLSDGDACTVYTSSGVYHYHLNATSGTAENSPYVIKPDDVGVGDQRWVLITPQAPFSHVSANRTAVLTCPSGSTITLNGLVEVYDHLSEFNPTTGLFTAIYTGIYNISVGLLLGATVWDSDNSAVDIYVNINAGATYYKQRFPVPLDITKSSYGAGSFSRPVQLTALDEVIVEVKQTSGDSLDTLGGADFNWLTIDRIA